MTKKELLTPKLLDCVDRLKRLIEIGAPGDIVGSAAWNVFATTLATYGESAGLDMIQHIRATNLAGRGICETEDCTNKVSRPEEVCKECADELDKSMEDYADAV